MNALLLLFLQTGCTFDEDLPHVDLAGKIRIPVEAKQFTLGTGEDARTIDDIRGLGPVYVGAFPSIEDGLYPYPHPEMGPILAEGQDGNTYPYGGSSVGRFDWACYQPLVCKVVTGRFSSYEDILDFFKNVVGEPLRTQEGHEVTSAAEFQERCFEVYFATGDFEMSFIGAEDFTEEDGYLVADFELPHIKYQEGMQLWGWIDMPSTSFDFNSCDPGVGDTVNYYNEFYDLGTNVVDLLNYPGKYVDSGDWVSLQDAAVITDPAAEFDLEIGYQYVE